MVTGASSGIGSAFAARLSSTGTDLVLVGRDRAALGRTPAGIRAETVVADLATLDGTAAVVDRLRSPEHPVDLLVHAAGLTTARPSVSRPWRTSWTSSRSTSWPRRNCCTPR